VEVRRRLRNRNKAKESALRSACRSDYMSHCSKVNPKGPRALSCLQRNAASLSPKCRAAVAAVGGRPAGAALPPGAGPAGAQPAPLAPALAPEANVAAVEAVSGHVVAFARGKPALLQNADIISDRTQLDLKPRSELRICHYRANRLLRLRGPARVSVSADGVTYEGGRAVDAAAGTCVPPGGSR
jgi:Cysteine rich repeat